MQKNPIILNSLPPKNDMLHFNLASLWVWNEFDVFFKGKADIFSHDVESLSIRCLHLAEEVTPLHTIYVSLNLKKKKIINCFELKD